MKKIVTVLFILTFAANIFADGGFSGQANYEPEVLYLYDGSNINHTLASLDGYNYGVKMSGNSWILKGGQATLVTTSFTTITWVKLWYRIYKDGSPGTWTSISLNKVDGFNPYGDTWNYVESSVNVLEHELVNEAGTYYLEFYFEALTSDDGTKFYPTAYQTEGASQAYFTTNSALPVELTTFAAFAEENKVALNWETATEVNNYGFEIERQKATERNVNFSDWEKIGFVEGHGNSNSPKIYTYTDNTVVSGEYYYRLRQVDIDGQFEYSDIVEVAIAAPNSFELFQNYPNPFNPKTNIQFSLTEPTNVSLAIYNTIGQKVAELLNQRMEAGTHNSDFDGSNLNSGIYIYMLKTDKQTLTKKMILMK